MENKNQEKKGRRFWRGLALVAVTVGVCYEIFARKGQDVKNAAGWIKNKVGQKQAQPEQNNQNSRQNGWNNNRRN